MVSEDENSTDCEETESQEDCSVPNDRYLLAEGSFPDIISKDQAKKVLTRALEILNQPGRVKRFCRGEDVEQQARNLLMFLTGDSNFSPPQSNANSAAASQQENPYCEDDILIEGTDRRISIQTMERIVELHRNGHSEKSIRGKYRWYKRQYLSRFERRLASGTSWTQWQDIDDYVHGQVEAAIDSRMPVHEYMMRQWALERANQIGADDFVASSKWLHVFKQRHKYTSLKVTRYEGQAAVDQREDIEASKTVSGCSFEIGGSILHMLSY